MPTTSQLVTFLNQLPVTTDFDVWGDRFKSSLQALLPDVDRVSVAVTFVDALQQLDERAGEDPQVDKEVVIALGGFSRTDNGADRPEVVMSAGPLQGTPAERGIANMRALGFPLDGHQPPLWYDYYQEPYGHVGSIVLWRDIGNPPISNSTRAFMESIEPFLCYVFSDFLARHHQEKPIGRAFQEAVYEMFRRTNLTLQEQKVMWLRMHGRSYKEIADILQISIATVGKHLNTIHHKTGTRSFAEVMGKYFAVFLDEPTEGESFLQEN